MTDNTQQIVDSKRALYKELYKSHLAEFAPETADILVRRLERACWNESIRKTNELGKVANFNNPSFCHIYSEENSRLIGLILNSKSFCDSLRSNPMTANTACIQMSEELAPDLFEEARNEITIRQNQRVEPKVSATRACKKCGNRSLSKLEYMGKALDELATNSFKCLVCHFVQRG